MADRPPPPCGPSAVSGCYTCTSGNINFCTLKSHFVKKKNLKKCTMRMESSSTFDLDSWWPMNGETYLICMLWIVTDWLIMGRTQRDQQLQKKKCSFEMNFMHQISWYTCMSLLYIFLIKIALSKMLSCRGLNDLHKSYREAKCWAAVDYKISVDHTGRHSWICGSWSVSQGSKLNIHVIVPKILLELLNMHDV